MQKQVLFIHSDHVVSLSIERQLKDMEGISLTIMPASNENALIDEMLHRTPDVIVTDSTVRFMTSRWIANHFKETPKLQIIVVETDNHNIQLYHKQEYPITDISDLVAAINAK